MTRYRTNKFLGRTCFTYGKCWRQRSCYVLPRETPIHPPPLSPLLFDFICSREKWEKLQWRHSPLSISMGMTNHLHHIDIEELSTAMTYLCRISQLINNAKIIYLLKDVTLFQFNVHIVTPMQRSSRTTDSTKTSRVHFEAIPHRIRWVAFPDSFRIPQDASCLFVCGGYDSTTSTLMRHFAMQGRTFPIAMPAELPMDAKRVSAGHRNFHSYIQHD